MTRLGIVVALAAEARTLGLRRPRSDEITTLSPGVMVCLSGIGSARARAAGGRLLAIGADALLSWGTAVALDSKLAPGHLLLPRSVLTTDKQPSPVSPDWRQQLHSQLGARFSVTDRPLIATDRVLTQPAQKQLLFAESGAVAADMESAALAAFAREAGVPFLVVRAIADSVDTRIPHWLAGKIDAFGRIGIASILPPLIAHPGAWPALAGLARNFRIALKTLEAILQNVNCADLKPATAIAGKRPVTIDS